MNTHSTTNVLLVSRENACRNLLPEACLRYVAMDGLQAHSCGLPFMVADHARGRSRHGLRHRFGRRNRVGLATWPGQPEVALWDYPDIATQHKIVTKPGDVTMQTLHSLRRRIELFAVLCAKGTSHAELRHDLQDLAFV